MTPHDARLLIGATAAVAAVVLLVARLHMHAFAALLLVSLVLALGLGMDPARATAAVTTGFGQTLGAIAPILGLGAMLGALLEGSGGAGRLAARLVALSGPRRAGVVMAAIAMLVGAPLFFETGVVLLLPLIVSVGAELDRVRPRGAGVVRVAVPTLAGLSVMHALVPPHPGPLIALAQLGAPLGRTFLLGAAVAAPLALVAGPAYGRWAARRARAEPPLAQALPVASGSGGHAGTRATLAVLLTPVALILVRTVLDGVSPAGGALRAAADVLGSPVAALLCAVLLGGLVLRTPDRPRRTAAALSAVSGVILVIGAGGALKEVLVESGVGPAICRLAAATGWSPLFVGWMLAALVRVATGSSTVATLTAAGALAAARRSGLHADPSLLVLAVGGGSVFLSHVNDAGFWLVRESLGMSLGDTFRVWSLLETVISVAILGMTLVLAMWFPAA